MCTICCFFFIGKMDGPNSDSLLFRVLHVPHEVVGEVWWVTTQDSLSLGSSVARSGSAIDRPMTAGRNDMGTLLKDPPAPCGSF